MLIAAAKHAGVALAAAAALLPASASALTLQQPPDCGLPADPKCLVTRAQYTVLGTVLSNTLNASDASSADNYNATLFVHCVWASFTNPPSSGQGLAGNQLLVVNWGLHRSFCPPNTGTNAIVNNSGLYFIYVANPPPFGAPANQAIYAVQAICAGDVPASDANRQLIANILKESPANAISASNMGSQNCALPPPNGPSGPSTTGSSGTSGASGTSSAKPTNPLSVPDSAYSNSLVQAIATAFFISAASIAAILAL